MCFSLFRCCRRVPVIYITELRDVFDVKTLVPGCTSSIPPEEVTERNIVFFKNKRETFFVGLTRLGLWLYDQCRTRSSGRNLPGLLFFKQVSTGGRSDSFLTTRRENGVDYYLACIAPEQPISPRCDDEVYNHLRGEALLAQLIEERENFPQELKILQQSVERAFEKRQKRQMQEQFSRNGRH